MNPFFEELENDRIAADLREAVDEATFDYPVLVAGVHHRAGRIRRRRALTTGAIVAVLGPAMVGGSALVLPDLLPSDSATVAPASHSDAASATTEAADAAAATQATDAAPTPVATQAPWQDSAPPLPENPESNLEDVNQDDAWVVPDARPVGVEALDTLGAPQLHIGGGPGAPVSLLMVCDPPREGGVATIAYDDWSYFDPEGGQPAIYLTVTGWSDSRAARDGLVHDDYTSCVWGGAGQAQPWPGQESDEDFLVVPGAAADDVAAVVRQGDYLVAVTVSGVPLEEGTNIATEIAAKTADNLQALDPVHGRDH